MEHNHNTEDFVMHVCAYHRAMATYRYSEALHHAMNARDSAPCDSEARSWSDTVAGLDQKLASGFTKLMRNLGLSTKRSEGAN